MNASRAEFAALCARWQRPSILFVHLKVHGTTPWAVNSQITRVDVAGVTAEHTIVAGGFSLVDATSAGLLVDFITLINAPDVELRADDGDTTPAWIAAKWPGARPRWGGARQIARLFRLAEPPAETQPYVLEQPGSQTGAGLALVLSEEVVLQQDGQFDLYREACTVLAMLAVQAMRGYAVAPDAAFRTSLGTQLDLTLRVHPGWSVISEKGHPIVTARQPPVTMLVPGLRRQFPAPPGTCWIRLGWQQPELRLWAAMSHDVAFTRMVRAPDPFLALRNLLNVPNLDRETLKGGLYQYLHGQPATETIIGHLALRCRALFPILTLFLDGIGAAVARKAPVFGYANRRLTPPGAFPLRRLGHQAQATAVNQALVRLCGTDPADFGLSQVIPIFDTVTFCIAGTDTAGMARAVKAFCLPLGDGADGEPLEMLTTMRLGPTWGATSERAALTAMES